MLKIGRWRRAAARQHAREALVQVDEAAAVAVVVVPAAYVRAEPRYNKMVAMKIRHLKDNKSPGVDRIPPKLLFEIVKQISILLATVFSLSLEEGIVSLEWKEANIIPLFKKGSRNKFADDTKVFRKIKSDADRQHLQIILIS